MQLHENYRELVLRLARTDFKLRYHNSVLGYVWAVIKPLLVFTILNFVFSSIFNFRNSGTPYYPLELLTGILLFNFFAEGTISGMTSLLSKAQLVTKIYVPRWTIVVSATINALFVFCVNTIVLIIFFAAYKVVPSWGGVGMFFVYVVLLYTLIVAFSLFASGLLVRFRDLSLIWEVLLSLIMYSAPIIYPLSLLPVHLHKFLLLNPVGFIIHFTKEGLISGNFAKLWQVAILVGAIAILFGLGLLVFRKMEKRIAEYI